MKKKLRLISIVLLIALAASIISGCSSQEILNTAETVLDTVEVINEILGDDNSNEAVQNNAATEQNGAADVETTEQPVTDAELTIDENGSYDTKDEVALYIHTYGKLPGNYVTKKEAEKAGWSSGALDKVLPGKCIGGSRFGNYEGLLPDKNGRVWTECDINTLGKSKRGAERIVFSNDGLIYYTGDHYESFELLYGDPEA